MALDPIVLFNVIDVYRGKTAEYKVKVNVKGTDLKLDGDEREMEKVFREAKVICEPVH